MYVYGSSGPHDRVQRGGGKLQVVSTGSVDATPNTGEQFTVVTSATGETVAKLTNSHASGYTTLEFFNNTPTSSASIGWANASAAFFAGQAYFNTHSTAPIILAVNTTERVRVSNTGATVTGTFVQAGGSNGQGFNVKTLTELVTIEAAASSPTLSIQIPLDAIVLAVSVRVTVAIPTAATFTVTGTTSGTTFNTAAVSTALNSTDVGTASCPYKNGAAQTITITPNLQPVNNNGRVRVTIHYYDITVPTS